MISLIVKVDNNNLIGDSQRNCMPWEDLVITEEIKQANSADMKHFVQLRKGQTPDTDPDIVIMWRKTWDSIPAKYRPFRQNINYIISRNTDLDLWNTKGEIVQVFNSVEACLQHSVTHYPHKDIHIIGGGQIYQYVLEHDLVDRIDLTRLDAAFEGDVYFSDLGAEREESDRQDFDHHSFITYHKK